MAQKDILKNTVGICVKDSAGKVISQNEKCLNLCGDKIGNSCVDGCMARYLTNNVLPPFDLGAFFLKGVNVFNTNADILMVNNGNFITSVLYESAPALKEQLEFLKQFRLTKSELEIIDMVLRGFENQKIASYLFISKGTLRTHLNNIYRKVPVAVKEQLLFIHKNKKI